MLPKYQVSTLIGRGGMGAVYLGRQDALDRPVAIKILPPGLEQIDPAYGARFRQEAMSLAKLNHPGIVAVYDFGRTEQGLWYIVMEYVDGTDVGRMLEQQGRVRSKDAMAITAHVCDALAYAHARGIIHRDIKPANILIGTNGVVKVADFGLAKTWQAGASSLTISGHAMGTPHYIAPEALTAEGTVDARADVYALGVMLYHMLTGDLPRGLFEPASHKIKGLDQRFDPIITQALKNDPAQRYQGVEAMRRDLDALLTRPVVKVDPAAAQAPAALNTVPQPRRQAPPAPRPKTQLQVRQSVDWGFWLPAGGMAFALAAFFVWKNLPQSEKTVQPLEGAAMKAIQITEPRFTTPVDMSSVFNEEMDHLRVHPAGEVQFGKPERDFVFPTPAKGFMTENHWRRQAPQSAHLETHIPQPRRIYAVLTGSAAGDPTYHGKQVGLIILHFADGTQFEAEIKAGMTLRAETWGYDDANNPQGSVTDGPVTWSNVLAETQNRGRPAKGFLDMLEIRLPAEKAATPLTGITIKDTSRETLNTFEPGFCIYAISVGHGL